MHGFSDIKQHKLDSKPSIWKNYDYNMWADYIELLCLRDGVISDGDILDIVYEGDVDNEYKRGEGEHLDSSVKLQGKIDDYFGLIEYRINHCGSFYPFSITDKNVLQLRTNPPKETCVYLYLLLCSSIPLMEKSDSDFYSNDFEVFCSYVFETLFPKGAKVELFGPRNKEGKYKGVLAERIKQLGETLDLESLVDNSAKYKRIPGGDGGLDIVGYFPIDSAENIPFAFGQITCNYSDWLDKQNSVIYSNWCNRLQNIVQYPAYMLIPFSFHNALDRFSEPADLKTFLIDRIRVVKLAQMDSEMKKTIVDHCSEVLESE